MVEGAAVGEAVGAGLEKPSPVLRFILRDMNRWWCIRIWDFIVFNSLCCLVNLSLIVCRELYFEGHWDLLGDEGFVLEMI